MDFLFASLSHKDTNEGQIFVRRFPLVREEVSLIHQTAREFLESRAHSSSTHKVGPPNLSWQHCLNPAESNELLGKICIELLLREPPKPTVIGGNGEPVEVIWIESFRTALGRYAHDNWHLHFNASSEHGRGLNFLASWLCFTIAQEKGSRLL